MPEDGTILSLCGPDYIAHVSNNAVAPVPKLINEVHRALANAGQGGCYAGEGRTDQSPKRISPAWEMREAVLYA